MKDVIGNGVSRNALRADDRTRVMLPPEKRLVLLNSARSQATTDPILTSYAQGLTQDVDLDDVEFLAPSVPVGATLGHFKRFDDRNHFQTYNTARALGGKRTRMEFSSDDKTYDCRPQSLEIPIDDMERDAAGDTPMGQRLLEQGKVRSLVVSAFNSEGSDVFAKALDETTPEAGAGVWTTQTVDPIKEINDAIEAIALDTGLMPNRILFGLPALAIMMNNDKMKERVKSGVTTADFGAFKTGLLNPGIEHKVSTWVVDSAKKGGTRKTKSVVGASVFIFFARAQTTVYDPSFMKTFRGGERSIQSVSVYREESAGSDIYFVDWSRQVQLTSGLCGKRIDVS